MNDIIRVDGLPGITVQGERGETGDSGCHTWCFDENSDMYEPVENASETIGEITDIDPLIIGATCEINDYIIHQKNERAYLYKTLERKTVSTGKPDAIECIDSWICDESFDITVIASSSYIAYDKAMLDSSGVTASPTSLKFISFDIISNNAGKKLGDIRIDVELMSTSISAGMASAFPEKWNWDSIDSSHVANNAPFGYIENYNGITDFDNEDLGNYKVTIKDFSEASSYTAYSSPIKIRCSEADNYVARVYVYSKKEGHVYRRELLGEVSLSDI